MAGPTKTGFVAAALKALGHEVPDGEALRTAVVAAARDTKASLGIEEGPSVALTLNPVAGAAPARLGSSNSKLPISAGMAQAVLAQLGIRVSASEVQNAVVQAARDLKSEAGVDPGPAIGFGLSALPASSKDPKAASGGGYAHRALSAKVLQHLGHKVDDASLEDAVVKAAREVKREFGADPSAAARLSLTFEPK